VIVLLLLVAAIALGALLPRELFARGNPRSVTASFRTPPDLDPIRARAAGERVWNAALKSMRSAEVITASMVQPAGGDCEINVELRNAAAARKAVADLRRMDGVAGFPVRVRARPSAFIEGVAGDAGRTEIIESATTDRDAEALGRRIVAAMERAGFRLRDDDATRSGTALALRWNEQILAANGIDRSAVERQVRAALKQSDVGQSEVSEAENTIRLMPATPADLATLPVRISSGRVVPLTAVAGDQLVQRTPLALHDQGRPARRLTFEGGGDPVAIVDAVPLGRGERIRLAGHARELQDAFGQMKLAFVLAVVLLYLTIAAFYESLVLPLLVMTAIPFAAGGAMIALLVCGQSLNVMSLIGLILLGGLVVNHTVVLIDRVEQLRAAGTEENEALRAAASERYRPVVMTTATAILGMVPLALLGGDGVELRRAIAVAVIGGLITATIGTLLLIPLLHAVVEPYRRRQHRKPVDAAPELANA
jgi:HAE1 family hydrophobic/amphiphilic exporter-1